jgi:hypothetical protein
VGSYLFLDCDSLDGKLPDLLTNIAFLSSKKLNIDQQGLLFLQQYFFGSHKPLIAKRLLTVSIVRANVLTGEDEPHWAGLTLAAHLFHLCSHGSRDTRRGAELRL